MSHYYIAKLSELRYCLMRLDHPLSDYNTIEIKEHEDALKWFRDQMEDVVFLSNDLDTDNEYVIDKLIRGKELN